MSRYLGQVDGLNGDDESMGCRGGNEDLQTGQMDDIIRKLRVTELASGTIYCFEVCWKAFDEFLLAFRMAGLRRIGLRLYADSCIH